MKIYPINNYSQTSSFKGAELKNNNPNGDIFNWALNKLEKDAILAEYFAYSEYNAVDTGDWVQKQKRIRKARDENEAFRKLQKIAAARQKAKNNS